MEVITSPSSPEQPCRKRSKSSVFKSLVSPNRSRNSSPAKNEDRHKRSIPNVSSSSDPPAFALPPDHPFAASTALSEIHPNPSSGGVEHSSQDSDARAMLPPSEVRRGLLSQGYKPQDSLSKRKLFASPTKGKENERPLESTETHSIQDTKANGTGSGRRWFAKNSVTQNTNSRNPIINPSQPTRGVAPARPSQNGDRGIFNGSSLRGSENSSFRSNVFSHGTGSNRSRGSETSVDTTGVSPTKINQSQRVIEIEDTLDTALEAVLESRNISEHLRKHVRGLDAKVKADLVRHNNADRLRRQQQGSQVSLLQSERSISPISKRGRADSLNESQQGERVELVAPSKQERSRSKTRLFGKSERAQSKRPRSLSRPRSLMSLKNFSSSSVQSLGFDGSKDSKEQPVVASGSTSILSTPEDFIRYLGRSRPLKEVEIGRIHKLRVLTRNESVMWIDTFVSAGGMTELLSLLRRVMAVEWREEHEDLLLHECLACLQGLCTTETGLGKLAEVESSSSPLFPALLKMLFDQERKGPSEYNTRNIAINLMVMHLMAAPSQQGAQIAERLLGCLADPRPADEQAPLGFIAEMRRSRPYQLWCKEISNVTKEVFWIFLHHGNIITPDPNEIDIHDNRPYSQRHLPRARAPVATAPYKGGVEWDATNYLATHLDLMNAVIATTPTAQARNKLREDLRASGFEKVMGKSLRVCKEKLYGAVHSALKAWVAAAAEDGWPIRDVQTGPVADPVTPKSPTKSPSKGKGNSDVAPQTPQLDLPKLSFGAEIGRAMGNPGAGRENVKDAGDEGWVM